MSRRSGRGSTRRGKAAAVPREGYEPLAGDSVGRLVVPFHGDDDRQRSFDVSGLPLPGWHESLAAAWGTRIGAEGGPSTEAAATSAWGILGRFMRFLSEGLQPPATPSELTVAHLERFAERRRASNIEKSVLAEVSGLGLLFEISPLRGLLSAEVLSYFGRRRPTPPRPSVPGYSDGELARLTAAARTDVAAIRDRIQAGEDLLARYRDAPEALTRGDRELGAVLEVMASTGEVPLRSGISCIASNLERLGFAERLFVTTRDLVPLFVLFAVLSGRNAETIKELPVRHKVLDGRAVELQVVKRRHGDRRWFETVTWEIGPPGRELHTPGGLYLLLVRLMARSHEFYGGEHVVCIWRIRRRTPPGPTDHVAPFVASLRGATVLPSVWSAGRSRPVMADPQPTLISPGSPGIATEVDRRSPLRVSFNRIKTSVDARRTRQMGGHLPSAARTNTAQNLFSYYLQGDPTILAWKDEVIGEAFIDVEQSAMQAHRRLLEAAGHSLHVVAGPVNRLRLEGAGIEPETAQRAVNGELNTGWTGCLDHDHHPVTKKICGQSFLDCFQCGNCLVTRDHLPRLLALLDALSARRAQVDEPTWWTRYGLAWAAIRHDILAKFSPEERAAAERDKPDDAMLDVVENPWETP